MRGARENEGDRGPGGDVREGFASRTERARGAAWSVARLLSLGLLAVAGCQPPGGATARSNPCGPTYFVTGAVSGSGGYYDPGYGGGGYAGGYGGGGVWYDPGDGWAPGDPTPSPDQGGYDCSADPSCGGDYGSGDTSGDPNAGNPPPDPSAGGTDTSGGTDNGGSTDTGSGDGTGDTSGGDTSGGGDTSLHRRIHLLSGGALKT